VVNTVVLCGCDEGEGGVKKRGWVDISIDILESASAPLTKTRLMYRSNLNYVRFNTYFHDFLKKGLLEETKDYDGVAKAYVCSKQGKVLLTALRNAEKLFHEK
jgi:predicted transcriptional regulator